MSAGREAGRQRPRASWLAGRTLSARLITGVLLLLVGACAIIGVVTYLAVRGSMVSALDGQLRSASITYVTCIEATHQDATGQGGGQAQPGGEPDGYQPPPNSNNCSQGQPQGMLGVRIKNGVITNCGVVNGMHNQECPPLSAADKRALMALPVYHPTYPSTPNQTTPWSNTAYTVRLTSLDADYRVTAVAGHDGDILITGLPMTTVDSTLRKTISSASATWLSVLSTVLSGSPVIRMSPSRPATAVTR